MAAGVVVVLRAPHAVATPLGMYDEGNAVVPAWRLLHGELPYRDVWQLQAPGSAYLLAGCFRLFGPHVLVERAACVATLAATAGLLQRFSQPFLGPKVAGALAVAAVAGPSAPVVLRPHTPATLFTLAAGLAVARASEADASWRPAAAGGALVGVTTLFKHDFGALAYAVGLLALARRRRPRHLVAFHAALGAAVAPPLAHLVRAGLVRDVWRQAVVFPASGFSRFRRLSVPRPAEVVRDLRRGSIPAEEAIARLRDGLLYAGTAGAIIGGATACGARWRAGTLTAGPLLTLAFAAMLSGHARVRSDLEHLQPALTFALPMAGFVHETAQRSSRPPARLARVERWSAVLLGLGWTAGVGGAWVAAVRRIVRGGRPGRLDRASPVAVAPDLVAAVRFVESRVAPGGRIFVGNARHDRLVTNASLFYFLADRANASRFYNLHPGLATEAPTQSEIVDALEQQRTAWVVIWTKPQRTEPNASAASSGIHVLDEYLRFRYSREHTFGRYELWRRRATRSSP